MTDRRDDFTNENINDEPLLGPLLLTLWSYRRAMFIAFIAVIVGYLGVMLLVYAIVPNERLASLSFRLTFEGAERDQFPNGTKFSSAEIVATPVLSEVFRKNELERYGKFGDFKDAMFVLQSNPDLDLLSYEYQAKLADPKLSAVDRSRIEEEFRKKRESLKSAFFSLNYRTRDRVLKIPVSMLNKILQDTLSTWAQQAAERKGATRYNIAVISKNALKKDFLSAEDYVVAVDVLRSMIERALKSVDEMSKIPGAETVRFGEDQVALADVGANLEDLVRFKVEPLIAVIRTNGLSRNVARADVYFSDRLLEVQLAREQVRQRVGSLQEALRAYQQAGSSGSMAISGEGRTGGVTPQLSESFIDRLVQLSTQANDVKYRQDLTDRIIDDGVLLADLNRKAEYYDSMRKAFASGHPLTNPAMAAEVTRRTNELYSAISHSIDDVQAVYKLIAQQNLNPDTVLYSITSPFVVRTTSSLTVRTGFLYFVLTLFAGMIAIPLACLAHHYFRHWIPAAAPPASGTPRETDKDDVVGG
ncbi:MAG: hypothetical protein HYU53_00585 [Acidobacteria bacterium]|nr:hypothetical protein [Acidobacteriota bacterium]